LAERCRTVKARALTRVGQRRGRGRLIFPTALTSASEPFQPPARPASPAAVRAPFGFRTTRDFARVVESFRTICIEAYHYLFRRGFEEKDVAMLESL
jgi:hypothetical protein